ncbi:hypothetical protein RRG08_026232 [Elysia crispata]|uniref:Uncharacterized protein n=1 Tax=Elysia crispata TaxID=231223 RepID=A0AAE0ZBR4_9GAST|nr:hypothetical protein RRG08_026232 [Elysia crispata]
MPQADLSPETGNREKSCEDTSTVSVGDERLTCEARIIRSQLSWKLREFGVESKSRFVTDAFLQLFSLVLLVTAP